MPSNAAIGARGKAKTKAWLIERGYQVGNLEDIYWIFGGAGRPMIPRKRDQFGCDLIAMSDKHILFVQAKAGEAASVGTFPAARKEFGKFVFPEHEIVKRVIIAWPPRARQPRVIVVSGAQSEDFREYGEGSFT